METIFPVKFKGELTIDQVEGFVDVCMEYAAEIKIDVTFVRERKQCESQSNCNLPQVSGSAIDFERDLLTLINKYADKGLKKPDLIHKLEYITESCRVS